MKLWHHADEARKRICPVSLGSDMSITCAVDDCMAWRWVMTHIKNPENPDGDLIQSHTTHGFCGMAGIPNDKA